MFEKWEKRFGKTLIFLGVILLASNAFLFFFNEPDTDVGKALISSIKPEFGSNTTILILASTASWAIPLLLIFMGISIVKKSMKRRV